VSAIYVDADACPVKDEIVRIAQRHAVEVIIVSNGGLRPRPESNVRTIVVAEGSDAADDWIVERIAASDLAVTADIRLAARCLEKGASVLGPTGKPFTEDGIGMAVAMRDLSAHLRDAGEIKGFAPAFTKKDRTRFLDALERTLRALLREA
jgi:uncharacterized protein YaiI (UPF0178 family)